MKKLLSLISNDFQQVFRDKTLFTFLFAPAIIILFVRYFIPYLTCQFPVVAEYHAYIMMFGAIQTAILFGFITSFIILDEKDEHVLQVIRVLPISSFYFIVYRMTFGFCFSAFGAFAMIHLGGMAYPGLWQSVLLSLQYGLSATFVTLLISTYARNKVEGMAFFKGVNLILIIPIAAFFISGWAKYIFVVFPTYWTFKLYDEYLGAGNGMLVFGLGMLVYFMVIGLLYFQFKKRVFDR